MFVANKYLKPGMILEKDVLYQKNNIETVLLAEGQALNDFQINRIKFLNLKGAYIKSDTFNNVYVEPEINTALRNKALNNIREVYHELGNEGKITPLSINTFSEVVNDLIYEISEKMELSSGLIKFKNYDEYTYQHCLNVANLNISTGISMGLNDNILHDLGMVGLLHDIGKTLIPIEIVNKPEKLTQEEFQVMKTHPSKAVQILKNLVSEDILNGIESHHEKLDGSGYPNKLSKDNIPLYGRITAICDVYHALSSDRSYRKTCFPNEVIEYLMGCVDSHFDYEILKVFLKNVVAFPAGSFVKLSNGKTAIVIKNYKENLMRPIVRIINPNNTSGGDIDLFNDERVMNITITESEYEIDNIDYNSVSREYIG